jgi:hypothetical protein
MAGAFPLASWRGRAAHCNRASNCSIPSNEPGGAGQGAAVGQSGWRTVEYVLSGPRWTVMRGVTRILFSLRTGLMRP